mmetsp:Transcript_15725/g.28248  ORF Transcript_15725/g.28248 Transcript_15725/m.28248 type:complete len:114 (-) Transcript_15725:102-443(-)
MAQFMENKATAIVMQAHFLILGCIVNFYGFFLVWIISGTVCVDEVYTEGEQSHLANVDTGRKSCVKNYKSLSHTSSHTLTIKATQQNGGQLYDVQRLDCSKIHRNNWTMKSVS